MPQEQSHIRERQKTGVREPRRYKVLIHNDDFTTMDFVVKLLVEVFYLSDENVLALGYSNSDLKEIDSNGYDYFPIIKNYNDDLK